MPSTLFLRQQRSSSGSDVLNWRVLGTVILPPIGGIRQQGRWSLYAPNIRVIPFAAPGVPPTAPTLAFQAFSTIGNPYHNRPTVLQWLGRRPLLSNQNVTVIDAASAVDMAFVSSVFVTDSGSGVDSAALNNVGFALPDLGVGADSVPSVLAATTLLDSTPRGTDSVASFDPNAQGTIVTLPWTMQKSRARMLMWYSSTGFAPINTADGGSHTDSVTLQAAIPVSDTGAAVDSVVATQTNSVNIVDAGFFTEVMVPIPATFTLLDNFVGVDTQQAIATVPSVLDNGAGIDVLDVQTTQLVNTVDVGALADVVTVVVSPLSIGDSGTSADGAALNTKQALVQDVGASTDQAIVVGPPVFSFQEANSRWWVLPSQRRTWKPKQ